MLGSMAAALKRLGVIVLFVLSSTPPMIVRTLQALQVSHQVDEVSDCEAFTVIRHDGKAIRVCITWFRDNDRVGIEDRLGEVLGRVMGAHPS
jgi:hypothetical protein